jgi:hypothetical protein
MSTNEKYRILWDVTMKILEASDKYGVMSPGDVIGTVVKPMAYTAALKLELMEVAFADAISDFWGGEIYDLSASKEMLSEAIEMGKLDAALILKEDKNGF